LRAAFRRVHTPSFAAHGKDEEPMPTPDPDFDEMMARVRAGCPEAIQQLFQRYGHHVRLVVRRKLGHELRRLYDSTDFLQSVWGSFFANPGEEYHFASPEALLGYLVRMAHGKIVDAYRRRKENLKGGGAREESLEDLEEESRLRGPQATPSQLAIAKEYWERLRDGLSERDHQILDMLRQGHTHVEIAERLGVHPKMVQRLITKLTGRIEPR
jgi:RNA polymerase sigma factor (sigma-70 family)